MEHNDEVVLLKASGFTLKCASQSWTAEIQEASWQRLYNPLKTIYSSLVGKQMYDLDMVFKYNIQYCRTLSPDTFIPSEKLTNPGYGCFSMTLNGHTYLYKVQWVRPSQ